MFCGILGHKTAECHKAAAAAASASKAKACLAKASDVSKDSAEDPKKIECSSQVSAQAESCIGLNCATES